MITTSRSSSGACSEAYVLDAAAFFAGYQLYLSVEAYTVREVVDEVRDSESLKNLQLALSAGKVEVIDPPDTYRERVLSLVRELGCSGRLSNTDIAVLALTCKLLEECNTVVVISDDKTLRRVATRMGARTLGIKYGEARRG